MENEREPTPERPAEPPELALREYDDERVVKLFEPNVTGAFLIVDAYSVLHLGECA